MLVIPLPALGHPVPVCNRCFDGPLLGGYTLGEDGLMRCGACCPAVEVGSPVHPWPEDVRRAVQERVLAATLPVAFEVTAYNLCAYTAAAEANPHWLQKLVTWLQLAPAPDEPEPTGNWVGEVKGRHVFTDLKLDPPQPVFLGPSDYGDRYLFRFRDKDGNRVVWFTGETCPITDGWTGHLKATIKDHGVYGGEKQTIITRGMLCDRDGERLKEPEGDGTGAPEEHLSYP